MGEFTIEEKIKQRVWYMQRLRLPDQEVINGLTVSNVFSFGGGFRNGGLSKDAMKLLNPILSFDYMGAAEYEFGDLPAAFQIVLDSAKNKTLVRADHCVKVTGKYLSEPVIITRGPNKGKQKGHKEKRIPDQVKKVTFKIICDQEKVELAKAMLDALAKEKLNVKCGASLQSAVFPEYHYNSKIRGWITLHEGILTFVDPQMANSVAELFGLPAEPIEEEKKDDRRKNPGPQHRRGA